MSGDSGDSPLRIRESVWDYPRPPRIERCARHVRIEHGGEVVAESDRALRVLETASPPTIYVPAKMSGPASWSPSRGGTPGASGRAARPTST